MHGEPEDHHIVKCRHCGEMVRIGDCRKEEDNHPFNYSKSGREGYVYICPKCKKVAHSWYWKVS